MVANRGLGRGFDSLIPTTTEEEFDPIPADKSAIAEIDPKLIDPNPHQPRTNFAKETIDALASSIKEHGILQPLVAQARGDRYELIAGERRLRAAKQLKLKSVPVIVRSFDEQQSLELALVENIQREQLNAVETAAAYQKLIDQFNLTAAEVAKKIGRDASTIKNTIRLLRLPLEAKRALAEGLISEGHARSILSTPEEQQQTLLDSVIKNNWTVRMAEEFARDSKKSKVSPSQVTSEDVRTKALSKQLKTTVQIQKRAKGGRLLIHYKDDKDLDRILKKLN
ncbi:MAG: ParB/RepB/Spo0J family partition protein [Candidatus Saccharimonadales bacterium]